MPMFHIREAKQEDVFDMAKVRVDTWKSAYKGIVPDAFLENLSYERTAERWQQVFWEDRNSETARFVAENLDDEVIGIAICGPEQGNDPVYQGEIYVLYVLPENQHHGIGRALVAACVQHLIHRLRMHSMLVWVLAENPYRRFYESLGGKAVREKTQEIGGKLLSEVGYGWEELNGLL